MGQPGRLSGSGDYKGHGYIALSPGYSGIEVRLPIDAILVGGSQYVENGEVQVRMSFNTPCEGIWFLFDHIDVPIPEIKAFLEGFGNNRTSEIGLAMREGDVIGTLIDTTRYNIDFGVFDQRPRLLTYRHPEAESYEPFGLCFYDFFGLEIGPTLRSLVGGAVTKSDFC